MGGSVYNASILSTIHKSTERNYRTERARYILSTYMQKDSRNPERWGIFGAREKKKRKNYHAREEAIKPRCRLQLPSGPHTGTIPHHAVRSSRQSMRFTPCLLVISARPGVRLHR
jgi:hypothetical protein